MFLTTFTLIKIPASIEPQLKYKVRTTKRGVLQYKIVLFLSLKVKTFINKYTHLYTMVRRKLKGSLANKTLLHFRETKEMVIANYVRQTLEHQRKKSTNMEFIPLSAF